MAAGIPHVLTDGGSFWPEGSTPQGLRVPVHENWDPVSDTPIILRFIEIFALYIYINI